MKKWNGQKIAILGAARQGLALARFLAVQGAQIIISDQRPESQLQAAQDSLADLTAAGKSVAWVCGGHPMSLLDGLDILCLSGGVPLTLPLVEEAQKRGIPLSNDSQIFLEVVSCKVIGITGSAGKTTTTTLVGRMAQAAVERPGSSARYRRAWVGGNIGSPLIAEVCEMQAGDIAVMELSSFQLEIMTRSPQVAAVLNVTPNHLDRHGTMEAYKAAKARLLQFQSPGGQIILGRDDPGAWSLAGSAHGPVFSFGLSDLPAGQSGTYLQEDSIYLRLPVEAGTVHSGLPATGVRLIGKDQIALRGEHNLLNVMAACAIAAAAGLPVEAIQAGVEGFTGVPHRLEFVCSLGGADWYNDSIATAPERAMAAIRSFDEPLVLLAGGRDKNLPWEDFAALVRQRVDHLVLFGEAAELILKALDLSNKHSFTVTSCQGLHEAVQVASQIVEPGDVVLFSPGGTSFDEFIDFEERGECYVQWVKELL